MSLQARVEGEHGGGWDRDVSADQGYGAVTINVCGSAHK